MLWKEWIRHIGTQVLAVLLLLSLVQLGIEFSRNRRLEPARPVLRAGDEVKALRVSRPSGKHYVLDFSRGQHLLLVYSVSCRFCKLNLSNWSALGEHYGAEGTHFLSIDPFAQPADKNQEIPKSMQDKSWLLLQSTEKSRIRAYAVPYTVMIQDGRVMAAYSGVLTANSVNQLNSLKKGSSL